MQEETFLDFRCPYCGHDLSYPESTVGITQECPGCTQTLIVPERGDTGIKLPLPVETARLMLRRLQPRDWKGVLEFMGDEEVLHYLDWLPMDEEHATTWIEKTAGARFVEEPLFLVAEQKADQQVIGGMSVYFLDSSRRQAGFQVIVSRRFHRQGFGTEIAQGALDFCLSGLNLHRVATQVDLLNVAGAALLRKAGLRQEGEFIENRLAGTEWVSTSYCALLRKEWLQ